MFYNARYYSPYLNRWLQPDVIVPDGDKASIIPLTVDFHEPMFLASVAEENAFTLQNGFWSQLSGKQKEKAKLPWGPQNPQVLNRYAYVMGNPLRYSDPTGHETGGNYEIGYALVEDADPTLISYMIWFDGEKLKVTFDKDDTVGLFRLGRFMKFADDYAEAQSRGAIALANALVGTGIAVGSGLLAVGATGTILGIPAGVIAGGVALGGAVHAGINLAEYFDALEDQYNARRDAAEYFIRLKYPNCNPIWIGSNATAGPCN